MLINASKWTTILLSLCLFVASIPLDPLMSLPTVIGAFNNVAIDAGLTADDLTTVTTTLTAETINPALKAAGVDAEGMTTAELAAALTPDVLAKLTKGDGATKLTAYGIEINSKAPPRSPFDTTPAEVYTKKSVQAAGAWADFSDADLVANQKFVDGKGAAKALGAMNSQTDDESKVVSSALSEAEFDARPAALLKRLVQTSAGESGESGAEGDTIAKLGTLGTLGGFAFSDLFSAAAAEEGIGGAHGGGEGGGHTSGSKPPHRRRSFYDSLTMKTWSI